MASRVSWRRLFSGISFGRALIEIVALASILTLLLTQLRNDIDNNSYIGNMSTILLWAGLGYTIRAKITPGKWRTALAYEIVKGFGGLVLMTSWLAIFFLLLIPDVKLTSLMASGSQDILILPFTMVVSVCIIIFNFLVVRAIKYGWPLWGHIRRTSVVWELVNSHLTLILAAVAVFVLSTLLVINRLNHNSIFPNAFSSLPVIVSLAAGLIIVLLLIVLLPFSIFSYFVARQITRRIYNLVEVTEMLRAGDYGARVVAQGEDEIAQLQSNFNAMAAELENTLHELATERNHVAALLKSRRELIASVSHDLRTPIATLLGYIESTASRENVAAPAALKKDMAVMQHEALRLQHLVTDLFTVARAETGGFGFDIQAVDLIPLLEQVAASTKPLAWQKGKVQLLTDLPPQLPTVQVDAARLEQIVNNLIHNAIRHTPPGGLVVVSGEAKDSRVRIDVKDTGNGIPPEHLHHIWERFYQGESIGQNNRGAGLGLALVKELTEAMGGTASVQSEVDEGSCFSVTFPCT